MSAPGGVTRRPSETPTASRALGWSFVNTFVGRFGTLAIGIALARLLGPEEFGTYAVAFIALMAFLSFNELGVSLAIVRWKDDPAAIAPTVTTISLGMSAVLTGVAVVLAPWFTRAMGDPGATPLVQLLSLCILLNGVVATPAALMQRMFRQGQRTVADQVNVWVGALVSIALAVTGMGALALVLGRLAGATLSGILFLVYNPLPYRLGFDRTQARALVAFGLPLAGSSIIVFLVTFLDQLVVGHTLGKVPLGYYVLAANLAGWPVAMLSQPLRSVAPAMFARLQADPARMSAAFPQVLRPLSVVALPGCVALAVAADDVVRFVYGAEWAPAAGVLRWLALGAALRILFELAYDYLVVVGRSAAIFTIQLVWIAALVPALLLGAHLGGIDGAALALFAVSGLVSLPMYAVELRRAGIGLRALVTGLAVPALAAGLLAGVLGLTAAATGTLPTLPVTGLVTALAVAGLLWWRRSDLDVFRTGAAS